MAKAPKFSELNKIEEDLLVARLKATRNAIEHAGEKGRALEHQVSSMLRSVLPGEYGLSTGFIVYHTNEGPQLSPQMDIIIYDALRSGPIIRLETSDVFPLEAVYGCVEVKASLTSYAKPPDHEDLVDHSIEALMRKARATRAMVTRKFWVPSGQMTSIVSAFRWSAPRFYIFAFELIGPAAGDVPGLAQTMANESKRMDGTHVHGLVIADQGYLRSRTIDVDKAKPADWHNIKWTTDHPLGTFKNRLLLELNKFPRPERDWSPAVDQYQDLKSKWTNVVPLD